jgi:hypothetical protein
MRRSSDSVSAEAPTRGGRGGGRDAPSPRGAPAKQEREIKNSGPAPVPGGWEVAGRATKSRARNPKEEERGRGGKGGGWRSSSEGAVSKGEGKRNVGMYSALGDGGQPRGKSQRGGRGGRDTRESRLCFLDKECVTYLVTLEMFNPKETQ